MGLKILHSADWHLDSPFVRMTPEQRAYLNRAARQLPGQLAALCRREGCQLMILSGDLFDGPCSGETLGLVADALGSCGAEVLIAPGNHDPLGQDSPWVRQQWPENVHIFGAGVTGISLPELDCRVWGSGYSGMDCEPLLEGFRAWGEERYHIGVFHADPTNPGSLYCPVTRAQVRDSGLHYLALGHIHKAGSFRAGETLCAWPGSPMGRGWDETGERGVWIVELEETAEAWFVALDTPRFYELETASDDLDRVLPGASDGWFYRVTLTGSGETPLEELKDRYRDFANLELVDRRRPPSDPWRRREEDSLEGMYLRLLAQRLEQADAQEAECIRKAAQIVDQLLNGQEVAL